MALISFMIFVSADWTPPDNINLRDTYNITNLWQIDAVNFTGNLQGNTTTNLTGMDYIIANYFQGDGSGITGVPGVNASWNQSHADSLYYDLGNSFGFYNSTNPSPNTNCSSPGDCSSVLYTTNESYLSVNDSAYWYDLNSTNTTWFENVLGALTLKISQLTSWTNTWFSTKDTDDLTEGSANLYDNQTWNQTGADKLYYLITNPFVFYNVTNPMPNTFSYYNSTTPQTETDPIATSYGFYNSTNPQTETDPIATAFNYYNSTSPQPNTFLYYNSTAPQPNTFSYYNSTSPQTETDPIATAYNYWNETSNSETNLSGETSTSVTIENTYPNIAVNETWINESIDQKTVSITYNATSIETIEGTLDYGDLGNITVPRDGFSYNVSEDAGASPLLIQVNFSSVETFNSIILRAWYDGGSGHEIEICLWDYTTLGWDCIMEGDITDMTGFSYITRDVVDPVVHVSGNLVRMKLDQVQNGNAGHDFYLDYAALVNGFSTTTTTDHDALSGREEITNHPWALPINGSLRNMTGNLSFDAGSGVNWSFLLNVPLYYLESNPFNFYNSTNPQTETDPISAAFGYYNSTDFSISDYYLDNNPESYYNVTSLPEGVGTNETSRVNAIVGTNCTGTDKYSQIYDNGTLICTSDTGGAGASKWLDGGDYIYPNTTFADNVNVTGNLSVGTGGVSFEMYNNGSTIIFDTQGNNSFFSDNITASYFKGPLNHSYVQNHPADSDTTYTNGSGISLVGTEFNHSDTSSQASDDNSGNTFIQDILLDGFGHITSIVNAAVDFSAYVAIADLVNMVGNWSADKSDYWNTSIDIDTVLSADEIAESKIEFTTACASGNHYYLSGNDLACEADDDTTYSAGNGISLSTTTFSVAGGTALTQDASGLSVTSDGIGDDQLTYNTGQALTTSSSPGFTGINVSHFGIGTVNITCLDGLCNWYSNATDSCLYWPSGGKDCGA